MKAGAVTRGMVINDVIKKYPETMAVFNRFRVDSCCGGGGSIEKTATRDGVEVEALMEALNAAIERKLSSASRANRQA